MALLVAVAGIAFVFWALRMYREGFTYFEIPQRVFVRAEGRPTTIPKTVIRSFATPIVNGVFREPVFSTIDLNPDYSHIFMTDKDCDDFMRTHFAGRVYEAYDKLIPGAYKSDLWRMCYLYMNGGVYLDLNKTLLMPLRKVINGNFDLVTVIDRPSCCVWQGFLACRPGLPVMLMCIEKAVDNIENNYYGYNSLDITGPMMMGKVFRQYYGECVNKPGVYRKQGELIKLLYHAGDYHRDEFDNDVINLNNNKRNQMNAAWKAITTLPHYGELYDRGMVYKNK